MRRPTRLSRRNLLAAFATAAVVPSVARAERKLAAQEHFEVERLDVWVPGLDPAHHGMVVAQLSDLHIGAGVPDGRVIAAVNAVNDAAPELVFLTGDFVTSKRDPISRVPELLSRLKAPAWSVLGNHDHWSDAPAIRSALERGGLGVLQNENTTLRARGAPFTVVGIDDSATRHDDVTPALKGADAASRVVLTHTPACARKLPAWEGVLCLSGHTHGGQMDVPRLTEGIFKRVGQPWYRGYYRVRGNQLYVNRGLGFGAGTRLPRLNSTPEVTLFTLLRTEPA